MSERSVSVIIPAYRAAATIGRAIDSVLAQTRTPHEIIVIDDGSPDDLAGALAPYGERVRLVRQVNSGAASARNRGIDLATGELIAFLDADDYWEPLKLQRQLELLRQHPEVGLVAGHFYVQAPGQPRCPNIPPPPSLLDRVLRASGAKTLFVAKRIWTSTLLVRRGVLGEHRFDTALITAEDVDLWIRLVLRAPVYLLSEPLATCVLEAGSLSRSDVAADSRNMLAVIHRYANVLGWAGVRSSKVMVYREWAATHLGNGEAREAMRPAWQRVKHQPWSPWAWWILLKSTSRAGKTWLGGDKTPAPVEWT